MREQLVKFLEENYGDLGRFPNQNLQVDGMTLEGVNVVGNDECFNADEFYHYVLSGDKLYKAYFEMATDDDGEELELDCIDYSKPYRIEDVTEEILGLME